MWPGIARALSRLDRRHGGLEARADRINDWANDATNGKIPDIVEKPIAGDLVMFQSGRPDSTRKSERSDDGRIEIASR